MRLVKNKAEWKDVLESSEKIKRERCNKIYKEEKKMIKKCLQMR